MKNNNIPSDDPTPTSSKGPRKQLGYGKNNKIFTEEMANKAREILRKKLSGSQFKNGLNPYILLVKKAKLFQRSWYKGAHGKSRSIQFTWRKTSVLPLMAAVSFVTVFSV